MSGDQDFVPPPGKTAISLLLATGFVIMRPSADAAVEPPPLAVSVRLYVSNGASLGPPPGILPEGLPVTFGFGFGLLAGFGFGLLAAGAPVCCSGLAASVDGVMTISLIMG